MAETATLGHTPRMPERRLRSEVRDTLGELTEEWDRLVIGQPHPSPFLLAWWLDAAAGGRPRLLCFFDGDELVGGAAFELDRPGIGLAGIERVRSLGQGPLAPDHLDVVAAPGTEEDVLEQVMRWLHRPGNRVVDLDGLASDGSLARALAGHQLSRTGAPYAVLPSNPDAYMADRPGAIRSTVARTARRAERSGATIERVDPGDADRALADLARLHDRRWADDSAFLDAWDRFRRAAHTGMRDGSVVIHEIVDADGAVVATQLDLRAGRSLAFYQAGRSTDHEWRGAGSLLRSDSIAWAIRQGFSEYDMLRGDEPYKADWAGARREVVRVRFGVGPLGRAVATGADLWRRARQTATISRRAAGR